jgi:single-strand DNA-binding protein
MNLNKVFLIGRLTADPQIKTTPSGTPVGTFSLATNRVWINKDGEKKEDVQFHNVVVWGKQAEVVSQYLRKGSLAMVEGRLQTRSWQDSQGQNRRTTEIVCERLQLGPRSFGGASQNLTGEEPAVKEELPEIAIDEGEIKPENIPF